MSLADESKHRLELLKMARELANEEYINKRAEDHNDWLARVDVAWKTRGVRLPYPPFVPFPTEAEIVARAITLYSFVKSPNTVVEPSPSVVEPSVSLDLPEAEPIIMAEPITAIVPEPESTIVPSTWQSYINPSIKISDIIVVPHIIPEPILEPIPEFIQEPDPIPEPTAVINEVEVDYSPKPLFAETSAATPVVKKSLLTSWFQKN